MLVLSCSCASSYQPKTAEIGYSDARLAPDLFRVTFNGNAYTSAERAHDFALLRAAELVQADGFTWFTVVDESAAAGSSDGTNSASFRRTARVAQPGAAWDTRERRSDRSLLVRGYTAKPDGIFAYEAASVAETIKRRYGVP